MVTGLWMAAKLGHQKVQGEQTGRTEAEMSIRGQLESGARVAAMHTHRDPTGDDHTVAGLVSIGLKSCQVLRCALLELTQLIL